MEPFAGYGLEKPVGSLPWVYYGSYLTAVSILASYGHPMALSLNFGAPRLNIQNGQIRNLNCLLANLPEDMRQFLPAKRVFRSQNEYPVNAGVNSIWEGFKKNLNAAKKSFGNEGVNERITVIIYVDPYDRMLADADDVVNWLNKFKSYVAGDKSVEFILIVNAIPSERSGNDRTGESRISSAYSENIKKVMAKWLKFRDAVGFEMIGRAQRWKNVFYHLYDTRRPLTAAKSSYVLETTENYRNRMSRNRSTDFQYQFLTTIWCMNVNEGAGNTKGCAVFDGTLGLTDSNTLYVEGASEGRIEDKKLTSMQIHILPPSDVNMEKAYSFQIDEN